jgi:hypothetical protein
VDRYAYDPQTQRYLDFEARKQTVFTWPDRGQSARLNKECPGMSWEPWNLSALGFRARILAERWEQQEGTRP